MTVSTSLLSDGGFSTLNITGATNVLGRPGTVYKVVVNATAAKDSTIIDSTGTTAAAGNTILTIPASTTVGTIFTLNWPCMAGIAVVPGSGVTLAVSFGDNVG